MIWSRKLWGVEWTGRDGKPVLIGDTWNTYLNRAHHEGEPTRALLFNSRRTARAWCAEKMAESRWRFRPVRVVESVRKI